MWVKPRRQDRLLLVCNFVPVKLRKRTAIMPSSEALLRSPPPKMVGAGSSAGSVRPARCEIWSAARSAWHSFTQPPNQHNPNQPAQQNPNQPAQQNPTSPTKPQPTSPTPEESNTSHKSNQASSWNIGHLRAGCFRERYPHAARCAPVLARLCQKAPGGGCWSFN